MLLTEDPEKVPATRHCPAGGSMVAGCAPGFFAARKEEESRRHHNRNHRVAHACCPGYFCPANLICMMPCPLGAHCPRSKAELPPKPFQNNHQTGSQGLWCSPYAYQERPQLGCGGADKWTIIPQDAFPGTPWKSGTGNLYCKPRYYCPNTTAAPVPCPRGKFCRQGSTEPARCPPGAFCPALTEVPISNFGGVTADALLLGLLSLLWWASSLRRRMLVRLGPRERLKVTWHPYGPRYTVVEANNGNTCAGYSNGRDNIMSLPASLSSSLLPSPLMPPPPPPRFSSPPEFTPNTTITATTAHEISTEMIPLEIEFRNLSLRLKACGRLVLSNVSAKLKAAKLTAIIGASGAGKSSLLSALAGRAPYGDVSGTVYINGKCTRLELYRRVTGFVPQDDILYAALSVEENLIFAARFRLAAGTSEAQRRAHVDNALSSLGLENVRRDIVGDEAQRGLSGGQRKRVSIGVELVAAPRLLLLDEPTSGLDAAGARALVSTLLSIVARDKVTAAAVVHQPRHEAFLLFDDVLLLGRGGRAAYYGPVTQVEEYFLSLGHRFPDKTNPADALLDILAAEPDPLCEAWAVHQYEEQQGQRLSPSSSSISGDSISSVVVLGSLHEETSASLLQRAKETTILASASLLKLIMRIQDRLSCFLSQILEKLLFWKDKKQSEQRAEYSSLSSSPSTPAPLAPPPELPPSPGFNQQFIWCLSRAAILRSREPVQTFTDIAIIAATGTTIGLLSDRGRATILTYASQVSYSCVALGLMATVGSIPTFTENEAAFRREAASGGFHSGAYFAALSFFDFIGSCIRAAAYLATWASFANPKTVLWQFYLVSLGLFWFCSGIGYVLALGLGSGTAQLAAAVLTLIATLVARQPEARGLLSIIQQFSFARWSLEGFVIAESNRLSGVWLLARCADLLALRYDVRRFKLCLVALTVLGVAARGLALGMLVVMTT
ncbi:hypothetical protein KSW81_004425 [Nannochloris sp. 'desiccata']|nr:hypothetical protein KSW81_004425 [Chlorella desiccata (nom. nud.)]